MTLDDIKSVYFVGAGGIGMSALNVISLLRESALRVTTAHLANSQRRSAKKVPTSITKTTWNSFLSAAATKPPH